MMLCRSIKQTRSTGAEREACVKAAIHSGAGFHRSGTQRDEYVIPNLH